MTKKEGDSAPDLIFKYRQSDGIRLYHNNVQHDFEEIHICLRNNKWIIAGTIPRDTKPIEITIKGWKPPSVCDVTLEADNEYGHTARLDIINLRYTDFYLDNIWRGEARFIGWWRK